MSEQRKIAKQLYEKHFPYTDSEIAWTAWKMAFDLGVAFHKEQVTTAEKPTNKIVFASNETVDEALHF